MAEFVYSLEGEEAARLVERVQQHHAAAEAAAGGPAPPLELSGRWHRESGEPAGEEFPLNMRAGAFVEYPGPGGEFTSAPLPPALSFAAEVPPGAAALDVIASGATIARVPAAALAEGARPLPPPRSHRIGAPDAHIVLPVFAERFSEEQKFLDAVIALRNWIVTQPPFDEPAIGGRLAFDAHFWPSDPDSGLFGTDDSKNQGQQLFYGNLELARQLLAPWIGARTSLILIDSHLRGGAGGQRGGYSAWASIAAAPGEHWEAIGLHEVGHALGLADEYLYAARANEWPEQLEPNISRDARPSRAPWADKATVGDNPAPTGGPDAAAAAAGTVGTFQGARYRPDLYRPSPTCLMRQTNAPFCAVCTGHIREQLGG